MFQAYGNIIIIITTSIQAVAIASLLGLQRLNYLVMYVF